MEWDGIVPPTIYLLADRLVHVWEHMEYGKERDGVGWDGMGLDGMEQDGI